MTRWQSSDASKASIIWVVLLNLLCFFICDILHLKFHMIGANLPTGRVSRIAYAYDQLNDLIVGLTLPLITNIRVKHAMTLCFIMFGVYAMNHNGF